MKITFSRKSKVESRRPEGLRAGCTAGSRLSTIDPRLLAFTLIEVVVAVAVFFMAMFAILGVMSQCIRAVGSLQKDAPTAGMVAAMAMANEKWEEGNDSGDFGDFYPDWSWETSTNYSQIVSPGQDGNQPPLYQLDIVVKHKGQVASALSVLKYSAASGARSGHAGSGFGTHGTTPGGNNGTGVRQGNGRF